MGTDAYIHFHTSALDCPDFGSLSWAHRGIFLALVLLGGRFRTNRLDTLENTAWRIRCDIDEFREAVSALIAHSWITEEDGLLKILQGGYYAPYAPGVPESPTLSYKQYLATPHWKCTRREALKRVGAKCERCGALNDDVTLVVHHLTYDNIGHESPEDLMVLCQSCHGLEHTGDRNA